MSYTKVTACGTQSMFAFLTGQGSNIDCPQGMLPERDPATGDWARLSSGCFKCSTVSVIDPTTGQPRNWQGTSGGGLLPTALNYHFPQGIGAALFGPTKPGDSSGIVMLLVVAVGGTILLSLLRGRR